MAMLRTVLLYSLLACSATGFTAPGTQYVSYCKKNAVRVMSQGKKHDNKSVVPSSLLTRYMSNDNGEQQQEFSRQVRLREEVESPFRKVRYFFYITTAGGAFTSLGISMARIAAALNGINTDLMTESLINAGVDITGLALVAYLYNRDKIAEESRLKRATKGAELAKLMVRASKKVIDGDVSDDGSTFTTSLASLRRGRGIEKRVVIAAAGKDKINDIIKQAK